jgi:hypothetical protein
MRPMIARAPNAVSGQMVIGTVEQHALMPARMVHDTAAQFGSVRTVRDQRAYRVRSIVNAKGGVHTKPEYLLQSALVKRKLLGEVRNSLQKSFEFLEFARH